MFKVVNPALLVCFQLSGSLELSSDRQRAAIVEAAVIPLMAVILSDSYLNKIVISSLGALIVVIEGIQQLFQFQTNWILYRSTWEGLKREKYLYVGNAGPYAAAHQSPLAPGRADRVSDLTGA
jgi:Protein of unknown function (DUF4231)